MSKLLKKVLKSAILPGSLMIVAKLMGIYIATLVYSFPLFISQSTGSLFTVQLHLGDSAQVYMANSFSNAMLLTLMNAFTLLIFLRHYLYLKAEGNPRTIIKLTKINMLKWVTDKKSGFIRVFTWTFFLLATNALIISDTLSQASLGWIGALALLSSLIFMWGLLKTFELETATIYPSSSKVNNILG